MQLSAVQAGVVIPQCQGPSVPPSDCPTLLRGMPFPWGPGQLTPSCLHPDKRGRGKMRELQHTIERCILEVGHISELTFHGPALRKRPQPAGWEMQPWASWKVIVLKKECMLGRTTHSPCPKQNKTKQKRLLCFAIDLKMLSDLASK